MTGQSTTSRDPDDDFWFLREALVLAERGRGGVSPNPLVGAILARDREIIGEGFHAELGGPHAERAALDDAARRGADPAGATLYVTLEPCAHEGRQPACSAAIVAAGVGRVVIASDDPSAKAAGRGPEELRAAGVEVEFWAAEDELAVAARRLNQPFRKHSIAGRPWVLLKTAMSLDGRTATPPGASPWISGEPSRELVHVWRAECDAVGVGIDTVLADDPLLTARPADPPAPVRQPTRVVFDTDARLPLDSRLVESVAEAPLLVVTGPEPDERRAAALREAGAETVAAGGATPGDRLDAALVGLGGRGLTSLMLEGGATLAGAFGAADLIDAARVFVAPLLLGGPAADLVPFRREGTPVKVETVGDDALVTTRFKEW